MPSSQQPWPRPRRGWRGRSLVTLTVSWIPLLAVALFQASTVVGENKAAAVPMISRPKMATSITDSPVLVSHLHLPSTPKDSRADADTQVRTAPISTGVGATVLVGKPATAPLGVVEKEVVLGALGVATAPRGDASDWIPPIFIRNYFVVTDSGTIKV